MFLQQNTDRVRTKNASLAHNSTYLVWEDEDDQWLYCSAIMVDVVATDDYNSYDDTSFKENTSVSIE